MFHLNSWDLETFKVYLYPDLLIVHNKANGFNTAFFIETIKDIQWTICFKDHVTRSVFMQIDIINSDNRFNRRDENRIMASDDSEPLLKIGGMIHSIKLKVNERKQDLMFEKYGPRKSINDGFLSDQSEDTQKILSEKMSSGTTTP